MRDPAASVNWVCAKGDRAMEPKHASLQQRPSRRVDLPGESQSSAAGQLTRATGAFPTELNSSWQLNFAGHLEVELTELIDSALSRREPEDTIRVAVRQKVDQLCNEHPELQGWAELEEAVEKTLNDSLGLGPLESLLRDQDTADILINGPRQIFIERYGRLEVTPLTFNDEQHLLKTINKLIAGSGRRVDAKTPLLDLRLVDGSRLNVIVKPVALNGPIVSIRRCGTRPLTIEHLLKNGALTQEMVTFLAACVKARINILISGGTGSGKTTLLNCLSRYIPHTERIATIEDVAELQLQQPHVVMMEARPASKHEEEISIRDLVKNTLRMRPDRIIVGECRGSEVLDMLQAMNTGHEGSLTTIHANSAREALSRMELMIGIGGVDIPPWVVRKQIASSIHVIVQVTRLSGGQRKVTQIAEVAGTEGDVISMHELFEFVQTGVDENNAAIGHFQSTGIPPLCLRKLASCGAAIPMETFAKRRLDPVSR